MFASTVGYGAAALALAARLYDSERLLGADERRARPGRLAAATCCSAPRAPDATASAHRGPGARALRRRPGACCSRSRRCRPGGSRPASLLFEWVGLLGLTSLYARGSGRRLAAVLRLRASVRVVAGGRDPRSACRPGSSLGLLAEWILPAPKQLIDDLRRLIAPPGGERGLAFTLFLTALTPAICEEALFRGPILRGLRTRFSAIGAAILTGLLFGLYHGNVWRLLPTALLGIVLSAIALGADSIVPAMVAHFVNNACLILLTRRHFDEAESLGPGTKLAVLAVAGTVLAAGFRPALPQGARRGVLCSLLYRVFVVRRPMAC